MHLVVETLVLFYAALVACVCVRLWNTRRRPDANRDTCLDTD